MVAEVETDDSKLLFDASSEQAVNCLRLLLEGSANGAEIGAAEVLSPLMEGDRERCGSARPRGTVGCFFTKCRLRFRVDPEDNESGALQYRHFALPSADFVEWYQMALRFVDIFDLVIKRKKGKRCI